MNLYPWYSLLHKRVLMGLAGRVGSGSMERFRLLLVQVL